MECGKFYHIRFPALVWVSLFPVDIADYAQCSISGDKEKAISTFSTENWKAKFGPSFKGDCVAAPGIPGAAKPTNGAGHHGRRLPVQI